MPSFNPDEQRSLMALLSGLQGGMTGSSGMTALQGILGGQQTRMANRDARMGSLIDLITNAAGSGQSYEGASALAGAYTQGSNIPPRIQDALGSLYPGSGIDPAAGGTPGPGFNQTAAMQPDQNMMQAQSPIYQAQPMSPQDQLAQMQLGQAMQDQQASSISSPIVASTIADEAMATLGTPDPTTGAPVTLGSLISTPQFQSLDPTTQAMVLQEIQTRMAQQAQELAQAQALANQPAPPSGQYGGLTPVTNNPKTQTYGGLVPANPNAGPGIYG